jgi:hypothetical protein
MKNYCNLFEVCPLEHTRAKCWVKVTKPGEPGDAAVQDGRLDMINRGGAWTKQK